MNDQLARSLFMDYLYDEISDPKKQRLEAYLKEHPDLRTEFDQLKQTRTLLKQMPDIDPAQQLLVIEPRERTFSQWWTQAKALLPHTFLGKTGFAAAAVILMLLIVGSLTRLHIDTSGNGVAISLGYTPTISQGITPQQTNALINQIRKENAAMLAKYAQAINEQNQQQLKKVVGYFQEQRMNDLQLVDQTLNELQQNTNYKLQKTNEYLGQVLQTVSYKEQN